MANMFLRATRNFQRSNALKRLETFILPQPGEGIAEVEIVQWLVKPGEHVKEFQLLCEARSDKGFIEYKSPHNGIIKEILYKSADLATIGTGLYKIDIPDSTPNESAHQTAEPPAKAPSIQEKPVQQSEKAKVLTTPFLRNLARKHNLDLASVKATGKDGRILKDDVLKHLEGPEPEPQIPDSSELKPAGLPVVTPRQSGDKVVKLSPLQRGMLKTMTASLKIPHLTYCEDVYMDPLISLRQQLKQSLKDFKLTFMPFFIKALSLSMIDFPIINSTLNDSTFEYTTRSAHNISFAMDSPLGLIVPNIKNVESKSIYEIAQEMTRLQNLGAQGKLSDADLKDGTVNLSNIGTIGGTYVSPVILPPQVFIGAFGATRPRVEKCAGEFVEKAVLTTSWSADHRLIDGATTARVVAKWKALIENPSLMLLNLK